MITYVLLEHQMNHIFIGKNIFIRIHYILEYMQILQLIMKSIIQNVGDKTTNIYKQNPVLNGYYIKSELENVLESGYYESPLGYDNVGWFVKEVIKLEK